MVTAEMHGPELPLHPAAGEIVAELIYFNGVSRLQLRTISSMIWGEVFESSPHNNLRLH
jgi:hypothetical protein